MGLNNDTYLKNQSKSPPPKPKSSYSYLGYSFCFAAYFLGYYFLVYLAAGFDDETAGADPADPILARPLEINLLTSFPFNDSMSLLRSSSETLALAVPKTFLISAAAFIIINFYKCLFYLRGKGGRKQLNTSWFIIN